MTMTCCFVRVLKAYPRLNCDCETENNKALNVLLGNFWCYAMLKNPEKCFAMHKRSIGLPQHKENPPITVTADWAVLSSGGCKQQILPRMASLYPIKKLLLLLQGMRQRVISLQWISSTITPFTLKRSDHFTWIQFMFRRAFNHPLNRVYMGNIIMELNHGCFPNSDSNMAYVIIITFILSIKTSFTDIPVSSNHSYGECSISKHTQAGSYSINTTNYNQTYHKVESSRSQILLRIYLKIKIAHF